MHCLELGQRFPMSMIAAEYRNRIDAMTPAERVSRSAAMFVLTRNQIERQIVLAEGEMEPEVLKWKIALRLYGNSAIIRQLIARELANVSS